MQVSEIQLFQILKEKVGEEQAKTLTEYVEAKIERQFDLKKSVLATRDTITDLKFELKTEILDVKNGLKAEIFGVKNELRLEMANHKSEIIKWIFIFWVGQLAAMIAIAEFLLKK